MCMEEVVVEEEEEGAEACDGIKRDGLILTGSRSTRCIVVFFFLFFSFPFQVKRERERE